MAARGTASPISEYVTNTFVAVNATLTRPARAFTSQAVTVSLSSLFGSGRGLHRADFPIKVYTQQSEDAAVGGAGPANPTTGQLWPLK